jgi:hypothetical protein
VSVEPESGATTWCADLLRVAGETVLVAIDRALSYRFTPTCEE